MLISRALPARALENAFSPEFVARTPRKGSTDRFLVAERQSIPVSSTSVDYAINSVEGGERREILFAVHHTFDRGLETDSSFPGSTREG